MPVLFVAPRCHCGRPLIELANAIIGMSLWLWASVLVVVDELLGDGAPR